MSDNNNDAPLGRNPIQYVDDIDFLLLQRQYYEAAALFLEMLSGLGAAWSTRGYQRASVTGDSLVTPAEVCERATLQWRQLLESDIDLLKLDASLLLFGTANLHALIMGSSAGTLDDFIMAQHRQCGGQYQAREIARLLLAWCPNSRAGFDIFSYYHVAPELVLGQAVATIGGLSLVSPEAERARNAAIDLLLKPEVKVEHLSGKGMGRLLMDAWMRCSYADHPRKHEVKRFLTEVMVTSMAQLRQSGSLSGPGKVVTSLRQIDQRPVLVVPLESFSSGHAMYRCYADMVIGCRRHFYTVGLAMDTTYDQATCELFDEFIDIREMTGWDGARYVDVAPVIESIRHWKPAALYYPSVGMVQWVVELSNERLAPVQAMSIGHPATSMSPAMDYVLVDRQRVTESSRFSEKVVKLPYQVARFRIPPKARRIAPIPDLGSDDVIRLAIPSVSQKLNGAFVSALRYAQQRASRKVEFVFFLGSDSVFQVACTHNLRRELKHVTTYPMLDYNDYITELNRCHLHVGTFPFGGTNSLLDSLRQGLPILALEGDEPHARIDSDFVRRAGLPESFVCYSPEEYGERLLALVENPQELHHWRRYLIEKADVDSRFMTAGLPDALGDALIALVRGEEVSS